MATKITKKNTEKELPTPAVLESVVYTSAGEKTGTVKLPASIFGIQWNADLVHQVIMAMQANARTPIAHTKDRGEVRGGGRKPWQQKGTGRARAGSSRSPIWRGGGVSHGPRNEKIYAMKVNRQARQKALLVALSRKLKDGEIIFVDSLSITTPKTAQAKVMLSSLAKNLGFSITKKQNAALIALPTDDRVTMKSFANIANVSVEDVRNLNPQNVLSTARLIIVNPSAAIEVISKKRVVKAE